jgi:hypothetical protein
MKKAKKHILILNNTNQYFCEQELDRLYFCVKLVLKIKLYIKAKQHILKLNKKNQYLFFRFTYEYLKLVLNMRYYEKIKKQRKTF